MSEKPADSSPNLMVNRVKRSVQEVGRNLYLVPASAPNATWLFQLNPESLIERLTRLHESRLCSNSRQTNHSVFQSRNNSKNKKTKTKTTMFKSVEMIKIQSMLSASLDEQGLFHTVMRVNESKSDSECLIWWLRYCASHSLVTAK